MDKYFPAQKSGRKSSLLQSPAISRNQSLKESVFFRTERKVETRSLLETDNKPDAPNQKVDIMKLKHPKIEEECVDKINGK